VFRYILIKLLERQINIWKEEVHTAQIEYDCVCLTAKEIKKAKETKALLPNYIYSAKKIIEKLKQDKIHYHIDDI